MPTLLPREMMLATSVISALIQRPSPSDHRVGFSNSFTRLRLGSLALRPALLLFGNLRPRVTTTPLPHATGAYGQFPRRDFNPLDLLLLLRTAWPLLWPLLFTGLGGFRRARPESPNMGWRNASFRGYADYMQTAEFAENLAGLMELATHERVALMCAEAVPWRCHRSLIADALLVHGIHVEEIISRMRVQAHALTSFAKVNGMTITYPPYEIRA